jgi:hypothetical protein
MTEKTNETAGKESPQVIEKNENAGAERREDVVRITELEEENRQLREKLHIQKAEYVLRESLKQFGALSPNLLKEQVLGSVRFDEEGEPANVGELISKLRKEYPEQFRQTVFGADAAAGRAQAIDLTAEMLSKMTAAEIRKLGWERVRAALEVNAGSKK